MRFKFVEDFEKDSLLEKTTFEYELGKHLCADINNRETKTKGLRAVIVKKYKNELIQLIRSITNTKAAEKDIINNLLKEYEVHHIDGLHKDNSIVLDKLALVKRNIHKDLTKENYEYIGNRCKSIVPVTKDLDVAKLILRLIVIMNIKRVPLEHVFNFDTESINNFLQVTIPQEIEQNFNNRYPKSTADVILLRDIAHVKKSAK